MSNRIKKLTVILLAVAVFAGLLQLGTALAQSGLFGGSKVDYKDWLAEYDVHDKFAQRLDQLANAGHSRSDLMVGYAFLYDQYGTIEQLEPLVAMKEGGKSWSAVFDDYLQKHAPFQPRSFEPGQLESLTPELSSDDIMIADHIAYATGEPIMNVIKLRLEKGSNWKEIAAERDIVNGSSTIPRVQITEAQMNKYATASFGEERVAEAFVLAGKLGQEPGETVAAMKAGRSETAIMAAEWTALYGS
ncbi:hypothetical protein [Paenibacillus kobensis]|uniref:hypothetical protein n=1 Tax=Paenibacillus kobensis TaxID=59841 RepID=UPI000FD93340|nr:hypothetical protein [Paenibacillus kobensis]